MKELKGKLESQPKQRDATTTVTTPNWQTQAHAEKPRQAQEVEDESGLLRDSSQKAMLGFCVPSDLAATI